jgi:hypothetical protein
LCADDASPATVDFHDKIVGPQIPDWASIVIDNSDVNGDDFDAALESRRLLILRLRGLRGGER